MNTNTTVLQPGVELAVLIQGRTEAKRAEDTAIARRRAIDVEILEVMKPKSKASGSVTERVGDYKLTINYSETRNVDTDLLRDSWDTLPQAVRDAFRFKASVIAEQYKALSREHAFAASQFVTSAPATPSITIGV